MELLANLLLKNDDLIVKNATLNQNKIAWWVEKSSIYPFITVKCPHCGSINNHNVMNNSIHKHKICNLHYYKGVRVYYECPGYKLGIYIDS